MADVDWDGDLYTALDEFVMGTDPTNKASQLNFTLSASLAERLISCSTVLDRTYYLEYSEATLPLNWQSMTNLPGTDARIEITDSVSASNRLYRIQVTHP